MLSLCAWGSRGKQALLRGCLLGGLKVNGEYTLRHSEAAPITHARGAPNGMKGVVKGFAT